MAIEFKCPNPNCGQTIRALDEHSGRTALCPRCKGSVTVPKLNRSSHPSEAIRDSAPPAVTDARKPPLLPTRLRRKPGSRRYLIIASLALVSAGVAMYLITRTHDDIPSTALDPNVAVWGAELERLGWSFESDKDIGGIRFVSYRKDLGALRLGACLVPLGPNHSIGMASFDVTAVSPYREQEELKDQAHSVCSEAIGRLVPAGSSALAAAVNSASLQGGDLSPGVPRWHGEAVTPAGWRITHTEYTTTLNNRDGNMLETISLVSPRDTASGRTNTSLVGISDLKFKVQAADMGFSQVAWKARVTNKDTVAHAFYVKCQFVDSDQMEVDMDNAALSISAGDCATVTGRAMMTTAQARTVHDILVSAQITQ